MGSVMRIQPLYMPTIGFNDRDNRQASSSERISDWIDAAIVWAGCPGPIGREIARQLRNRPRPPDSIWGDDPERIHLARLVCRLAHENLWWPNDHFIPEDPARVAFFEHEDGLDLTAMVIDLEQALGTRFSDQEVLSWLDMTLGDVIDWLRNHPQAS